MKQVVKGLTSMGEYQDSSHIQYTYIIIYRSEDMYGPSVPERERELCIIVIFF